MNISNNFEHFCGGPFWISSLLVDNTWPQFTECFMTTVLVWLPCGYAWLLLPYFLYDVNNKFSSNNLHRVSLFSGQDKSTHSLHNNVKSCHHESSHHESSHHESSHHESSHHESSHHESSHHESSHHESSHHESSHHESSHHGYSPRGKFTAVCVTRIFLTGLLAMLSLCRLLQGIQADEPAAVVVAAAIYLATYLMIAFQFWYERRKERIAMFMSFYFYLFNIICQIIPLYTWIITQNYLTRPGDFGIFLTVVLMNVLCFLLSFVPDNPIEDPNENQQMDRKPSPEMTASYPSRLLFTWLINLIYVAYKKEITEEDLFDLNPRDQSRAMNTQFEHYWDQEVRRVNKINASRFPHKAAVSDGIGVFPNGTDNSRSEANGAPLKLVDEFNHKPPEKDTETASLLSRGSYKFFGTWTKTNEGKKKVPSLFRVALQLEWGNLFTSLGKKVLVDFFAFLGPIILSCACLFLVVAAVCIYLILSLLIDTLQQTSPDRQWIIYCVCFLLWTTNTIRALFLAHSRYSSSIMATHMKTVLLSAIYKKALFMSSSARKSYTVGDIVNLMSVDCQRIQENLAEFAVVATVLVQIILATALLYVTIGPPMIIGIILIVVSIVVNTWIVSKQKVIQEDVMHLKDKRIKLMDEILNAMKVLKLYAWETRFKKQVEKIRSGEIELLNKVCVLFAFSETIMGITPFLCNVAVFAVYVLLDRDSVLDAKKAFVTLALFNLMRIPLLCLKLLVKNVVQIHISIERIHEFLLTSDLDETSMTTNPDAEHAISIQDGTFTWDSSIQPSLWNVNITIPCGQLTAIVGPVGSGKSSLVSAILGEMEKIRGQVTVKGTIAYVSQQAWIQNASIRDNILFGQAYNKRRYKQVVKACQLDRDFSILEAGDLTEIGEKGINLSGGQKQRVSLARAVYSQLDIYLFDDPLSAVDAHVGKAIFENVLSSKGLLAGKTRILVTHGIHWLPQVDYIFVLINGRISEQGSYTELISHNGPFAKFQQEYSNDPNSQRYGSEVETNKKDLLHQSETSTKKHVEDEIKVDEYKIATKAITWDTMFLDSGGTCHIRDSDVEGPPDDTDVTSSGPGEGKLTVVETLQTGKVKGDVLITFGRAAGLCLLLVAFLAFLLNRAAVVWANFFLTDWTKDPLVLNATMLVTPEGRDMQEYYIAMYGGLFGSVQLLTYIIYNGLYWRRIIHAAEGLHHMAMERLFHAPMSFFDQTPTGRILNRLSKDVDTVDSVIPVCFNDSFVILSVLLMVIVIVIIQSPIVISVLVPIAIIFIFIQKYHRRTVRQLKRIESITRSPVFTHLSETFTGATIIRAYGATQRFIDELEAKVDQNQILFFTSQAAYSWLQLAVDGLGNALIFISSIFIIQQGGDGGDIGLSVSTTLQVSSMLTYLVKQVNEVESSIVSVERLTEYSHVEQEAPLINPENRPPTDWPSKGAVAFKDYQTRYREGLDLVLKGLSCEINGGEKVGIVGRTGAGKSSFTLSLFRVIEAVGGSIIIDGINIADIGLHDLRSKITVLPQDPVIFSGSIRSNIDPFDQYTEEQLWKALERSYLKDFIAAQPEKLNFECGQEGSNLSVGQRQLICLARSLLRRTKVLVLDEATAAVDMETDALIQKTIKEAFTDCTVIAIAHRINTILEYDRIIVMDDGAISEFDTPMNLINARGIFYNMCRDAGLV